MCHAKLHKSVEGKCEVKLHIFLGARWWWVVRRWGRFAPTGRTAKSFVHTE